MLHTERIRVLEALQEGLQCRTTADAGCQLRAPVSDFTCRDLLAREQQTFFRDTPLLLGLSMDLPQPGSYLATSETGVPILLTRDADGRFHAFLNICRHRGVQVVPDGRGQRPRFTCPFHAWTYGNKGELLAVPHEDKFGGIDKCGHGLIALPAVEHRNMLWVRPSPGRPFDVDELLGGLGEEMSAWNLPENTFYDEQVLKADINWKLAIDTFGENYHFDVLHKETLAPTIVGNLQTDDAFGNNYRMVFALREGFEHARSNRIPTDQWPYRLLTLNVYFLYPNVIFLVDPAGIDLLRMYPRDNDPAKSITHHRYYIGTHMRAEHQRIAEETNEPPEDRFIGFNRIVLDEDYAVAASTQRNAAMGMPDHYIFGRNEPALHHYHNAHRRGLGLPELVPAADNSASA